jgi:protein arginine kinase
MSKKILGLEQRVREQRHVLRGLFGNVSDAVGDLYQVSNQSTLGRSEEEILYHLRHMALDILREERAAREVIMEEGSRSLEDRVWRAQGIAHQVRLLEFGEAMGLLSSLRLGLSTGMLERYSLRQLNELLVATQKAHIEMKQGQECDDRTLSMERADLFRARLS